MQNEEILMIQKYLKSNKRRNIWRKFVRAMACLVVFCTTYALILPVITVERDCLCGLEEHVHGELCYVAAEDLPIPCTEKTLGVHIHNGGCYGETGSLQCGYSDQLIHTHDELCVSANGTLRCQLIELPAHEHTEDCYAQDVLICGHNALVAHSHTEGCFDENGAVICGSVELLSHRHTQACIPAQTQPVLICQMREHLHIPDCYPSVEKPSLLSLLPRAGGDPATLNLNFTSWGPYNPIDFPKGNTYACEVGSLVTITLEDYTKQGVTYVEPSIKVSGCEIVSVRCTCGQGHSSHNNAWYNCGLRHEIVLRITQPSASIECNI